LPTNKLLDEKEEKDRLQQSVAIIKMEEKLILKEVLKLENWLRFELILILLIVGTMSGIILWEFVFKTM